MNSYSAKMAETYSQSIQYHRLYSHLHSPYTLLHTCNTRIGSKFTGVGSLGARVLGVGFRSPQAAVRCPWAFTLGSFRHSSSPWLLSGEFAARPSLPASKTGHTTFVSCFSLPGAKPRAGHRTSLSQVHRGHCSHHPSLSAPLHTQGSGPSLHMAAGSCKPLCLPTLPKSADGNTKSPEALHHLT